MRDASSLRPVSAYGCILSQTLIRSSSHFRNNLYIKNLRKINDLLPLCNNKALFILHFNAKCYYCPTLRLQKMRNKR